MKDCRKLRSVLHAIIPILLWIHTSSSDPVLSDFMVKAKAVKDRILSGYDKAIRPTIEPSNTTEVHTGVVPRQILDVDEEKGLFVLDSYFYMGWQDSRLKWNFTTEFNGNLQLDRNSLWLPDISIYNSHSDSVTPMEDTLIYLESDGFATWVPPLQTKTSCPGLSEAAYPYGVVTCVVQMGSWAHDGWEIDFLHAEDLMHTDEFQNINSRWELVVSDATVLKKTTYYEGVDQPFMSLNAVFPIRRRPLPEIEATRSPCILVMLLTLSMFWMPPDSSKKLVVGGIAFLALVIMLVYVAWSTRFPLGVLFAVSFLQSTMYVVVVSILLQVLVIFNVCNISGPVRPPPAAMQLLAGPFGKYACLRSSPSSDANVPIDRMQLKEDTPSVMEPPTPKEDWILFAAGLDRLFFVLMSVTLIAIHHL